MEDQLHTTPRLLQALQAATPTKVFKSHCAPEGPERTSPAKLTVGDLKASLKAMGLSTEGRKVRGTRSDQNKRPAQNLFYDKTEGLSSCAFEGIGSRRGALILVNLTTKVLIFTTQADLVSRVENQVKIKREDEGEAASAAAVKTENDAVTPESKKVKLRYLGPSNALFFYWRCRSPDDVLSFLRRLVFGLALDLVWPCSPIRVHVHRPQQVSTAMVSPRLPSQRSVQNSRTRGSARLATRQGTRLQGPSSWGFGLVGPSTVLLGPGDISFGAPLLPRRPSSWRASRPATAQGLRRSTRHQSKRRRTPLLRWMSERMAMTTSSPEPRL